MDVNDKQVGGDHYKTSVQHWDILVDMGYGPEYYIGQATKYLTRWRKKHGMRDLRKAQHFAEKLLALVQARRVPLPYSGLRAPTLKAMAIEHLASHLSAFFDANELNNDERSIITSLFFLSSEQDLVETLAAIEAMALRALTEGGVAGAHEGDEPASVKYSFIEYGEGHETITWEDKETKKRFTLPVDVPPSYRAGHVEV